MPNVQKSSPKRKQRNSRRIAPAGRTPTGPPSSSSQLASGTGSAPDSSLSPDGTVSQGNGQHANRRGGRESAASGRLRPGRDRKAQRQKAASKRRRNHPSDRAAAERSLKAIAAEIRSRYEKLLAGFRRSIQHAWRIGQLLKVAKKRVLFGKLEPWVQTNCDFSPQTARVYMRVASYSPQQLNEMAKRQPAGVLTLREFLRLTRKSTPKSPGGGCSVARTPEPSSPAVPPRAARFPESGEAAAENLACPSQSATRADMALVNGAPTAEGACSTIPETPVDRRRKKQADEVVLGEPERPGNEVQDPDSHLLDSQWVENLPLYRQLSYPARFAADALLWRQFQPLAAQLKTAIPQDVPGLSLLMLPQFWSFSLVASYFADVEHPREWRACTCNGWMATEERADCTMCQGTGYRLVRPYDELGCPIESKSADG